MTRCSSQPARRGVSLLELIVATAIMATLMASVVVMVRSAHSGWLAHRDDSERAESAYALLRHLVRTIRQADAVVSITASNNSAGALSLLNVSGGTDAYTTSGTNVNYLRAGDTVSSLLADQITGLTFIGYQADATTTTATVADIHAIECRATFTTPTGSARTVSSFAWLRSW